MTGRSDTLVIPAMSAHRRAMLALAITAAGIIAGISILAVVTRPPVAAAGAVAATAEVSRTAMPDPAQAAVPRAAAGQAH